MFYSSINTIVFIKIVLPSSNHTKYTPLISNCFIMTQKWWGGGEKYANETVVIKDGRLLIMVMLCAPSLMRVNEPAVT